MWGTSCAKHLDENDDSKEIIEEDVRFLLISCNKCEIIRGGEYIAHELAKVVKKICLGFYRSKPI